MRFNRDFGTGVESGDSCEGDNYNGLMMSVIGGYADSVRRQFRQKGIALLTNVPSSCAFH